MLRKLLNAAHLAGLSIFKDGYRGVHPQLHRFVCICHGHECGAVPDGSNLLQLLLTGWTRELPGDRGKVLLGRLNVEEGEGSCSFVASVCVYS